MIYERNCEECGRRFSTIYKIQKYCCQECKTAANKARYRELYALKVGKKVHKRKKPDQSPKIVPINEICRRAEAEHMSYGKYCAKYGIG